MKVITEKWKFATVRYFFSFCLRWRALFPSLSSWTEIDLTGKEPDMIAKANDEYHQVDGEQLYRDIPFFIRKPLWWVTSYTGLFQSSRHNFEPLGCKLQRVPTTENMVAKIFLQRPISLHGV